MNRDLHQTLQRFEAAENAVVKYKGFQWDEFENFLGELRQLEKICDQLTPPSTVAEWLRQLRLVRRMLRSAPINPGHSKLGLSAFVTADSSSFPIEMKSQFEKCQQTTSSLLQHDVHPSWEHIDILNSKNSLANQKMPINTLVTNGSIDIVNEIATSHGWNLNAVDLTRAKRTDIADLAIIFGSPEFHTNWRLDYDAQSRAVAWLFNSPIARETHLLSWPGSYKFDPKRYTAWKGVTLQNVSISGSTHFAIDIDRFNEFETGSALPPTVTDATTGHIAPVKATPIKLTENTWIFLSDDAGPSANYVDMDDFDVIVREARSIKELTPGTVLVVRDDDAGRSFLEDEALNWIVERHGESQKNRSLQIRDGFRAAVQELGKDQFCISKLKAEGLDEAQATRRLRLAHDPSHIAPQEPEEFMAICTAASFKVGNEDYSNIQILRTAYQQAGRRARKLLEEAIQSDTTWQATVETPAQAKISLSGMGSIVLAPIIEILSKQVEIPISRLGQLQKVKGNS